MDVQSEQKFQALKRRLDALQYHQPLNIESAALAEKLLNDLLKTTEGFQKLKKINEELKKQVSSDNHYVHHLHNFLQQEPLKQENERVVKENNQLHQMMIGVKEECEQRELAMKAQLRKACNERDDLNFLNQQKDFKVAELEKQLTSLKAQLEKALFKSFNPKANDIVQGMKQDAGMQENAVGRKQEMTIQRPIDSNSQNIDPNRGAFPDFGSQTQIWGDELRRADERALKFRYEVQVLETQKLEMVDRMKEFEKKIEVRDQEIVRLSTLYKGGQNFEQVKSNFDKNSSEEALAKQSKQLQFLNQENHRLESEMQEIKELLGICESKDPTDKDRTHLKTLVRTLKQRNEQLQSDKAQLEGTVTMLKSSKFTEQEGARLQSFEDVREHKQSLEEKEKTIRELEGELRQARGEMEKSKQFSSAFQSNTQAFNEKLEDNKKELDWKQKELNQMQQKNRDLENECTRLKDELSLSMQKCYSLQREFELQQNFMAKANSDSAVSSDQVNFQRDRIRQLEKELERLIKEKTDQQYEVRRIQGLLDAVEKEAKESKFSAIRNEGEAQTSKQVRERLENQVDSLRTELENAQRQKDEMDKVLKKFKEDSVESEKKAAEYYQQLLRTKENFRILQNEQKLLSEEITQKQNQLQKCEKEKLALEREMMQLRPLKGQLENYSHSSQQQIEANVQQEYENRQLQSKVTELQNSLDMKKADWEELNLKYNQQVVQNQRLVEQLKLFEKDSFEIQTRIRRGLEVENENDNNQKIIEMLRAKERDLTSQIEEQKQVVKFKDSEIDRLKNTLDSSQKFSKELEKEIQTLREEVQDLSMRLDEGKNCTVKSEQRKNLVEVEVLDLKKQLQMEREDKRRGDSDAIQIRKEYEEEKSKAVSLQQQNERLRALVENLDQTKEELMKRLQSTNKEKVGEEQDRALLINDINNYKHELIKRDQEIADLKKSIEALDSNVDDLQQELDQKTEELQQSRQQLERQAKDFSNVQHQISVVSGKEDNFQRRLFERENEIKALRGENKVLQEQVEELNQIVQVRNQEVQELTEDIQTLTRENMYVNQEFQKTCQANDFLKGCSDDLTNKEKAAQQSLRAVEMEKEDVLKNYRSVCQENERMQEDISQLGQENQQLYMKLQELERDLGGASHRMSDLQTREHQGMQEMRQLERHIDQLTHQLEMAHKVINELKEEKDAILFDMGNHRNLTQTLEANREDLGRSLAQLEEDKDALQQRIRDMQREVDALRKQIQQEKLKCSELEIIISNERRSVHEKDFKFKELQREYDEVKAERDRHLLRIQSLQSHIESLQKYGAVSGSTSNEFELNKIYELENKLQQAEEEVARVRGGLTESQTVSDIKLENQKLIEINQQYELQIQELERVLQNVQ